MHAAKLEFFTYVLVIEVREPQDICDGGGGGGLAGRQEAGICYRNTSQGHQQHTELYSNSRVLISLEKHKFVLLVLLRSTCTMWPNYPVMAFKLRNRMKILSSCSQVFHKTLN